MASSPSPLLKLEEQASGEHNDTWGDNLNATLVMIENAIAKRQSFTLTGGTTTLTDTQFVDNQSRSLALDIDGALSSDTVIVVPSRSKMYIVRNATTGAFSLTVKTAAGSGVVVTQGGVNIVWCDGTNVVGASTDASTFGGLAPVAYARLAFNNTYTKGNADTPVVVPDGVTIPFDSDAGNVQRTTLAGDRTATIVNASDGRWLELYITQDATGGRTLAWPTNIIWQGSAPPTLSTSPNAIDKVFLRYFLAGDVWIADVAKNFRTGGGSVIADVSISGANVNVDLFALSGSPGTAVTVNLEVAAGTTISSLSTITPALDLRGFIAGSTINIINGGYIIGKGGKGGRGALFLSTNGEANDGFIGNGAADGRDGGPAIIGPGTGITVNIDNGSGFIWGGGGGGGGGGASIDFTGQTSVASGGGGGGGVGAGEGGDGARGTISFDAVQHNAGDGGNASTGRSGAAGAGGAEAHVSNGVGGVGGTGGDWGTAGSAGTSPTSFFRDFPGGNGGAAGKAFDLNGGAAPAFSSGGAGPNVKGAIA